MTWHYVYLDGFVGSPGTYTSEQMIEYIKTESAIWKLEANFYDKDSELLVELEHPGDVDNLEAQIEWFNKRWPDNAEHYEMPTVNTTVYRLSAAQFVIYQLTGELP